MSTSRSVVHAVLSRRMAALFLLGFSSGLPLLLIGSTFKAWMTEQNVALATVGAFALVQLPYSLKVLWAPLMDRFSPPFLDRRRSWILVSQAGLAVGFFVLAQLNPGENLALAAGLCIAIAFVSATQDTAVDAYRREVLTDAEQGLGASLAVNGYRIGLLLAGAGALTIAQYASWKSAYLAMSLAVVIVMGGTLVAPALSQSVRAPASLKAAVFDPFREFLRRRGAVEILAFVLLFKLGDQMASDMLNPFYLKIGYEKVEIGAISKVFGLWATIVGGIVGGVVLLRVNIIRCLWLFGVLQMLSTFGFSWLAALTNPGREALALVVTVENLCGGMGTAAYVGFMASLTDRRFTATQYALLTSLMSLPRTLVGSTSGVIADQLGWVSYFAFCALIAIPGLLMLLRSKRWQMSGEA